MCGIIARIGADDAFPRVLTGLENLEYRGYDSAGVALQNGSGLSVFKCSGKVEDLKDRVDGAKLGGNIGIGHTRWSTHGPPSDSNAHPHTNEDGDVAVVHNGIIENHQILRERLENRGVRFESDTDTEVIPHLIDAHYDENTDPRDAFVATLRDLEGSYAVAAVFDDEDAVFAARRGSPLVLGLGESQYFLASDVPAFLEYTDRVVYFEDGDVVTVRPNGAQVTTMDGEHVEREIETVDWDPEETGKGGYEHYMLKEIESQPTSLTNTIKGRVSPESGSVDLDALTPETISEFREVQFVACGTSYHAALYGSTLLNEAGVRARAYRASEYQMGSDPVTDETLVVAVTQSGETADTLGAMRRASRGGATVLAVTNVMGSSAARAADETVYIHAGPEIGVAATKTFSSQTVTLGLLAHRLSEHMGGEDRGEPLDLALDALADLPDDLGRMLDGSDAERITNRYLGSDAYFFIGRGLGYPVAKESALKFKEITYEHAEGFASGELKHGPLALVTPRTPVFAVFTGEHDEKTLKNAKEAQTRGADVVAVAEEGHPAVDATDAHLPIPDTAPQWAGLLANVQLQLVSYHAANELGRSIDKPRNLAKSVTVE
ncbi:glutamine--fructose-6-phosphate transaminase (isomerizing) [Halorarum salinum]|uniref:Glutamine--fructose-6-phosphate aminotransferase [isomerizing] n=1 Tax=Halorarum salinum TaxID=2743089 RepID=A0A7D5QAL0_9EURY|nr:glutamine--fructose-6-phosphate transaminase (isomerizing) [Halobaculum salinum]QLG60401.1 glutamine--fructose-6-phosphate transaminase (isomerizing) [Halobaculum salinum]